MKIAVFGLGYVGTVTAACLAARGHDVWGVDIDEHKVAMIAEGRTPVLEPGLGELVREGVARGSLHATRNTVDALDGAEISLVCVGTPSAASGGTDLSFVESATEDIAKVLAASDRAALHAVVVRSTVPPGTVEGVVAPVLASIGGRVGTAMCPEFLREGSGVADFFDPPFTVVGTSDPDVAELLSSLFGFLDQPVRVVPVRTAESVKYACNAFHATKVAFANEMGRVLRPLGIDSREVMALFCEDRRLNISPSYLRPGFAFGGPCLPKDLRSLLHLGRMNSVDLPLLAGTLSSNELVLADVVDRVTSEGGMRVALLGLSFKVSSDDLRESPSVRLAETLFGKGYSIRIHDPVVKPSQLIGTNRRYVESRLPHLQQLLADSASEALEGADTAIVSSSDEAVVSALLRARPQRIFDLSGRLGSAVEALPGYEGVGW
ncbi:MAG TPA: nucleotide sugar dehydrogenase [Acidimicrobiales bacterium]|nr:nucleotide sugar dehydrogenase [Acidimicrobiales bacterium]